MKRKIIRSVSVLLCAAAVLLSAGCAGKEETVISYSLYPYLINYDYCRKCMEEEWAELHPEVELRLADYDCYLDGEPEGIDVIMYDAVLESWFAEAGYVAPISESDIEEAEDFFDFTLEDARAGGELYGIPVFLCADFYIYDTADEISVNAENIYDLAEISDEVLIHEVTEANYSLIMDVSADRTGRYIIDEEIADSAEIIEDIKKFGNADYFELLAYDAAEAYDSGVGVGYFGYSETMSCLENRFSRSALKMLSLSGGENIPLFYEDLVGISPEAAADEEKRKLCLELMNLMSSAEMMEKLARNDGSPSYLIFPRRSMYENLAEEDELYSCLYGYVSGENNHVIRHPAGIYRGE